jgi:hypothetical protein
MVKLSDFSEHIQKSFITPEKERDIPFAKIETYLSSNLYKGLIDEETYNKASTQLDNLIKAKGGKGEGSRGGKIIGHTKSGKAVYQRGTEGHDKFSQEDHKDASDLHAREAQKHQQEYHGRPDKHGRDFHSALSEHHRDASQYHEKKSTELAKKEMNPGEKKILADKKKKEIEHHKMMENIHTGILDHVKKNYHLYNHQSVRDIRNYHTSELNRHKSEKERLENEMKGY